MNDDDSPNNIEVLDLKSDDEKSCRKNWFIKRHNEIIAFAALGSLFITAVLAILTYFSLAEVKNQRELTLRQFVLANRPNISITMINKGLIIDNEVGFVEWKLKNEGGDVQDLRYKCILLKLRRKEGDNYSVSEFFVRSSADKYLNKLTHIQFKNEIKNKSTLNTIKELTEIYNKIDYLGVYLGVDYSIPSDLSIDGIERRDNRYTILVWDYDSHGFELLKTELFESVERQLNENNVLSKHDQG